MLYFLYVFKVAKKLYKNKKNINGKDLQVALVICGLFICKFTHSHFKIGQNGNFLVKNGLFICKFKNGPKWRDVSIANNEGNLYFQ